MHTPMKSSLLTRAIMATAFFVTATGLGATSALWADEPALAPEPTQTIVPAPPDDQGIQDRGLSTRKPSFQNRSQGILPGPSPTPTNPAVTGTPLYNLAEVLKRPDTDVLTSLDGQTIPPDAAFSTVDPRLIAELQALPDEVLIRQMHEEVTTRGFAGGPSFSTTPGAPLNNQDLTRPPLASKDPRLNANVPCGRFVGRLPEQRRRYFLSTVNKQVANIGINLGNGENLLILSGCFGPDPGVDSLGTVQIIMPPLDSQRYLPAQIKFWSEKYIIAELPLNTTGFDDGEIAVRVIVADGSSTNSRYGLFRAHR